MSEYKNLDTPEEEDIKEIDKLETEDEADIRNGDSLWDAKALDDGATEAEKAADFIRNSSSGGYEKLADYIGTNFDSDYGDGHFHPEKPIPIKTRNMSLETKRSETGVPFKRSDVDLGDDMVITGVFPEFEGPTVKLDDRDINDMSVYQQFDACKDEFQKHMYDGPEYLNGITLEDMERMDEPQGFSPKNKTWNHEPEPGTYRLVDKDIHSATAHTGSNAYSGRAPHRHETTGEIDL